MSATTSAATGRCFGIQRVCQVWERSRSALYARRARAHHRLGAGPARRGPPPRQSDAQLLAAIRTDLARSPFHGEGHRKVHARLRILDGIRVARTRVLRVMRAHGLLSPHRGRQGAAKTHDGRVITQAPNVMWGTDGVRVFTLDDGWGWIFAAVEHWNAECVGWHVCKVGSRFAALDPIAQGLERLYGSLDADVARGLALRMDHGSQYLSDHFLKQIRYWGIHPSFGFVEEPETNGVAERWNRTLKEQAIHGRIFQNLAAVRAAVADFVERYNQTWRLEKLGYHTRRTAGAATVNRETSALSRMFRLAVRSRQLDERPVFPERLEENGPRQGFFEHAEYTAVRQYLPAPYQDVLDVAYYSGWRKRKILDLRWDEVDESGGVVRLSPQRSKTRVGRVLPISPPIAVVLSRRRATRRAGESHVFHRDAVTVRSWRTAWPEACRRAGVPGRLLHDCRRTTARNLVRAGVPERVAMQLTGHKTRAIFDRYNIVQEAELHEAGARLLAYLAAQPERDPLGGEATASL